MSKDKYISAMDKIEAEEKLKQSTLEKATKQKKIHLFPKLVSFAALILIVFGLTYMLKEAIDQNNMPIDVKGELAALPTIDSYENLRQYVEKNTKTTRGTGILKSDLAIEDAMNAESSVTQNSSEYSTTNIQVANVDEADVVKTDGEYIYYLTNEKLVIVEAQNLNIVSKVEYDLEQEGKERFYPKSAYLTNDKLVVIGRLNMLSTQNNLLSDVIYGADYKSTTTAIIYDISNKQDVKEIRRINVEGNELSTRMIGDNVYIITNQYLYTDSIARPYFRDTIASQEVKYVDYPDIYYFPESTDNTYLLIASFNVNRNEEINVEAFLGAGQEIYCSTDSIYIVKTDYEFSYVEGSLGAAVEGKTTIFKFDINETKVEYKAKGEVPGYIINQFAMDEYDNVFRIATTSNLNNEDVNNLYTLDENLEIIGKIENLAPGERIYSVRFLGEKGYVVTFKQVDPLFAIDLSDPRNPKVLGELKIPGFSEYLHPYDENHLIGIGQDTEEKSNGSVVTNGMKLSMFDITDMTNPIEKFTVTIGDSGTYSEILYNHKCLLFSKEKNLLAFPITITEKQGNYTKSRTTGAIVYNVTLEDGFEEKGVITHQNHDDDYEYGSTVQRIIYIGDKLYTISSNEIRKNNIETLETEGSVEI